MTSLTPLLLVFIAFEGSDCIKQRCGRERRRVTRGPRGLLVALCGAIQSACGPTPSREATSGVYLSAHFPRCPARVEGTEKFKR